MANPTDIHPKTAAGTVAALITPIVAKLLGVDEAATLGLITAAITFILAWAVPSEFGQSDQDGDNVIDATASALPTVDYSAVADDEDTQSADLPDTGAKEENL